MSSFGMNRCSHWYMYVEHNEVQDYEKKGWLRTAALIDTHHGVYCTLMVWICDCEPPEIEIKKPP